MTAVGVAILSVLALGVVTSMGLAVYAEYHSDNPLAAAYRNVILANLVWTLSAFCQLVWWMPGSPIQWNGVVSIGATLTAVTFFEFACKYTGSSLLDRRWVRGTAWGLVVVVAGLLVTGDYHQLAVIDRTAYTWEGLALVDVEPAAGYVVVLLAIYVFVLVSFGLLAKFLFRTTSGHRKQCAVILFGSILVAVGNVAYNAGVIPQPDLPLGPILDLVKGIVVWAAIFRYDFLTVLPLARDTIVETIDDPVVVLSGDDIVAYANDAAEQLGIAESQFERPVEEVVPGLTGSIEDGSIFQYEPPVATDGGSVVDDERVFDPRVDGIVDQHGIEQGQVVVLHDITEQKRREERLEGFASIVSHDLRNPLNVASGHLEIERERNDSEGLQEVQASLDRMEQLIEELLKLAREGYDDIDPELLDLEYVATTAWEAVASGASTMTVTSSDRPIAADEHQLQEILENLFRNAIEHNDEPVAIELSRTEDGFAVADDGTGIPEDQRDDVFESGHTSAEDGTGYGLHIVEQFATAHGWAVTVTDSETGGATFVFECD